MSETKKSSKRKKKEEMEKNKILYKYLCFIENTENYYAGIYEVIKVCAIAKQLNTDLWDDGLIIDYDFHQNSERIGVAERVAIQTFEKWCIKRFNESNRKLSKEAIIRSVFNALFGWSAL